MNETNEKDIGKYDSDHRSSQEVMLSSLVQCPSYTSIRKHLAIIGVVDCDTSHGSMEFSGNLASWSGPKVEESTARLPLRLLIGFNC